MHFIFIYFLIFYITLLKVFNKLSRSFKVSRDVLTNNYLIYYFLFIL